MQVVHRVSPKLPRDIIPHSLQLSADFVIKRNVGSLFVCSSFFYIIETQTGPMGHRWGRGPKSQSQQRCTGSSVMQKKKKDLLVHYLSPVQLDVLNGISIR